VKAIVTIIDDDKSVREALQRMLDVHGFSTAAFASAEEFLGSEGIDEAACLLLDMRMPMMSGIALHRYLLSRGCRIPTILITACPTSAERTRAIADGVFSYLAKPLSEQILLDTVREALDHCGASGK
jgi:FixJ family two-component response regulator